MDTEHSLLCKCEFKGDLRRFRLLSNATFEDLKLKLESLYNFGDLVVIKYLDDQEDEITMATVDDFQEAVLLIGKGLLFLKLNMPSTAEEVNVSARAVSEPTSGRPRLQNSNPSVAFHTFNFVFLCLLNFL